MASEGSGKRLKLRAEDEDDLAVLRACLQDTLVLIRDLVYLPEDQLFRFVVVSRSCWEAASRATSRISVLCAIAFAEVLSVSYRSFRRADDDRVFSLLALRPERIGEETLAVRLKFPRAATVRLEMGRIECRVRDVGEPWPMGSYPRHEEEQAP